MPTLLNTLQGHDLGFLKIVANAWGIELSAPDSPSARPILLHEMLDRALVKEMFESLPSEARTAVESLYEQGGQILWAKFIREFGDVRIMGAARRDRERPDLKPETPVEMLWYRAMIGRAFLQIEKEPQEYAYIPEEFLQIFQPESSQNHRQPGRPASPGESLVKIPADDLILDDACTLVAGLRIDLDMDMIQNMIRKTSIDFLKALLYSSGILTEHTQPDPDQTRSFLESSRAEALSRLVLSWINSKDLDELRLVPTLTVDGQLENHPADTRQLLMNLLSNVPKGQWWNIESFIKALYQSNPDFQRTAGDYDSWFIKDSKSGIFLRGFGNWNKVDGALVYYMITGPMHWLGIYDLATSQKGEAPCAFRLSQYGEALWNGQPPSNLTDSENPIRIDAYGSIEIPARYNMAIRYQFARFCNWEKFQDGNFYYKLTPDGLERAARQGLKVSHFLTLVQKTNPQAFSPQLRTAMERWEENGLESRIFQASLLRVNDPQILKELQNHKASRFIQEYISPTVAVIKMGNIERVQKAIIELGYLTQAEINE